MLSHGINALTVKEIIDFSRVQEKRVLHAMAKAGRPLTMRQLELLADVRQTNICRILADAQERGTVVLVSKGTCPVSRYPTSGFYALATK